MLVWVQAKGENSTIEAAWRPAGGAFSAPVKLSSPSVSHNYFPVIAMDPRGDATAAWLSWHPSPNVVEAASRPAGGTFGEPTTLSSVGGEADAPPLVVMDPQGDAKVAWVLYNGVLGLPEVASRPAGGAFGKSVKLTEENLDVVSPAIAMDPQGDTAIAWAASVYEGIFSRPTMIEIATQPAGASLGAPIRFPLGKADQPAVAMDSRGDITVVWSHYTTGHVTIEASTRTASSEGFETPVVLSQSPVSEAEEYEIQPKVAMDAAGDTTVVWRGAGAGVKVATREAGGSFAAPIELDSPNLFGDLPMVAMDDRGDGTVVWGGRGEAGNFPLASTMPAGGAFGATAFLSNATDLLNSGPVPVNVALDSRGDAVSAWTSTDGTKDVYHVAGYQASGPQLEALQAPTEGQVGAALAFSVSPLSVWSTVASTTWSWGDSSPDTSGTGVTHMYGVPGTYQITVSATDALGNVTNTTRTVTIKPIPGGPPPNPPEPPPRPKLMVPPAVVSAFTPLFATRASNNSSTLGLLVEIAAVRGARNGDTIVVRCVAGCQRTLRETVHVRRHHNAHGAIVITPPLVLRRSTRIEIELLERGHIARYVQYRFVRTRRGVIAYVTRKGCLSPTGQRRACT
jgi:hypothetical protein